MKLSENFTLEELIRTSLSLPNLPNIQEEEKLLYLANYLLQPIRDRYGAIKITSGFRCEEVNLKVGGTSSSQHRLGEAVDFFPLQHPIEDVYRWIVEDSRLAFGQVIFETKNGGKWIHLSLVRFSKPNQEALVYNGKGYQKYTGLL